MQRNILNLSPLSDVLPTATHTLSSGEADSSETSQKQDLHGISDNNAIILSNSVAFSERKTGPSMFPRALYALHLLPLY